MTDMTPGSRWLLPVTYMLTSSRYGMEFDTASDTTTISWEDCESLIPADRITELEAEVARLTATLVKIHDVLFAPSGADEYLLRQLVWAGLGVGATSSEKEVGDVATD